VWRPAEADTSIRPGWFYHAAEDGRVRTVDGLVDLYFQSVGRNAKLLLNVPPTRDGVLHDTDVTSLAGAAERRRSLFASDLLAGRRLSWRRTSPTSAIGDVDLERSAQVTIIRLEEDIAHGQLVSRYTVSGSDGGEWRALAHGTTIGYARLDRIEPAMMRRLRVTVEEAVGSPEPLRVRVYSDR
jgi:alpha-L-fucosidase